MNPDQRKIELINWITTLNDAVVLDHISALKDADSTTAPPRILELLQRSASSGQDQLTEHTSAKDLLKGAS